MAERWLSDGRVMVEVLAPCANTMAVMAPVAAVVLVVWHREEGSRGTGSGWAEGKFGQ